RYRASVEDGGFEFPCSAMKLRIQEKRVQGDDNGPEPLLFPLRQGTHRVVDHLLDPEAHLLPDVQVVAPQRLERLADALALVVGASAQIEVAQNAEGKLNVDET